MKKAVITVIGQDKIGIMYGVASVLAEYDINILDVNQTIMHDIFTMIMIVDMDKAPISFEDIQDKLEEKGKEIGVSIRMQHEDIFNTMSEL
jgi:ACT domain-containing protein